MRHLDDLLYFQFQATPDALPAELWAHLRQGCAACATYLERRSSADAFDGRVDAALLGTPGAPVPAGEFDQVMARPPLPRGRARPQVRVAAMLIALIGGVVAVGPRVSGGDGTKGEALLTVATSFAVMRPDRHLQAGVAGGVYRPEEVLSVRLELSHQARISLVRRDSRSSEVLLLNWLAPAGRCDLRRGGEMVGVPLAGLAGLQEVRVVASEQLLSEADVRAASVGDPVPGTTVGGFAIRVAPSP